MSETNPFERVVGPWETVVEDMEATAAEYREDGFEVIELHPGDVTVEDGLDVLVPGDEYETVETIAAAAHLDSYEVYRATESGIVFTLVVLNDPEAGRAVCCPVYYEEREIEDWQQRTDEPATLSVRIRPLADDRGVIFHLSDFF